MELTAEEARVLGCLIEKSYTTPDHYPLTTNALVSACNQKSSRDPVVDYSARQVDEISRSLRELGLVRIVRGSGARSAKHKQVVAELMGLDDRELSVLAVLFLRGPQSPGELKTRTERYVSFTDLAEVEAVLVGLTTGGEPLVANLGRGSGQSQDRWRQMLTPVSSERETPLGGEVDTANSLVTERPEPVSSLNEIETNKPHEPSRNELVARVDELEKRVAQLEREWKGEDM